MVFIPLNMIERKYNDAGSIDGDACLSNDNGVTSEVIVEFIAKRVGFIEAAFIPPVHEGESEDGQGDTDGGEIGDEENKESMVDVESILLNQIKILVQHAFIESGLELVICVVLGIGPFSSKKYPFILSLIFNKPIN